MANSRVVDGPIGIVGAGYIGHLFAQQFALAGYDVRAWSPGMSAHTLRDRLQRSVSTLVDIGAVEPTAVDKVLTRVSTHDDLATALAPCAAVMESIVEDAQAKSACYRNIEAAIGADVLVWSSTSNFPMSQLAADMAHPRTGDCCPSGTDAADHLCRSRRRRKDERCDGHNHDAFL